MHDEKNRIYIENAPPNFAVSKAFSIIEGGRLGGGYGPTLIFFSNWPSFSRRIAANALKTPHKYAGFKPLALADTHAVDEDMHAATNAVVTATATNENTRKNSVQPPSMLRDRVYLIS